jgi:hypothetical protein
MQWFVPGSGFLTLTSTFQAMFQWAKIALSRVFLKDRHQPSQICTGIDHSQQCCRKCFHAAKVGWCCVSCVGMATCFPPDDLLQLGLFNKLRNILSLRPKVLYDSFNIYQLLWIKSPKERDHLEDQWVGGKLGSEWILERLTWGV